MYELLDRERVREMVRGDVTVPRRVQRDLYNAAAAAVWLGRQDQRPQPTEGLDDRGNEHRW
jgi:hypothetical protein